MNEKYLCARKEPDLAALKLPMPYKKGDKWVCPDYNGGFELCGNENSTNPHTLTCVPRKYGDLCPITHAELKLGQD